jgi:hypothetical protein
VAAFSHVKSDTIGDFTGTITGLNSQGSTTTIVATDLVRPSDWNSVHNFFQTITGNTLGTSTASGTNLVMGGTNGVQLSHSTAAGAATLWVQPAPLAGFIPPDKNHLHVAGQVGQGSFFVQPMNAPHFQADGLALPIIFSNSSNSSGSGTISWWVGVYTKNASTLSLLASSSHTSAFTMSGTAGSYSLYGGSRIYTFPWTTTFGGSNYWIGIGSRTTTAGANMSISQWLNSIQASTHSGEFGVASNATKQNVLGFGHYSATTSSVPGSIGFTQINGNSSLFQRNPAYFFRSGTV